MSAIKTGAELRWTEEIYSPAPGFHPMDPECPEINTQVEVFVEMTEDGPFIELDGDWIDHDLGPEVTEDELHAFIEEYTD